MIYVDSAKVAVWTPPISLEGRSIYRSFKSDLEVRCVNGILRPYARRDNGRPVRLFEIGTHAGRSLIVFDSIIFNMQIHSLDVYKDVCLQSVVDLLPHEEVGKVARDHGVNYTQHWVNSGNFDLNKLGHFDIIYIDGDHSFKAVMADTQVVKKVLEEGGTIIWHDSDHPETLRAIKELDQWLFNGEIIYVEGTSLCYWRMQ